MYAYHSTARCHVTSSTRAFLEPYGRNIEASFLPVPEIKESNVIMYSRSDIFEETTAKQVIRDLYLLNILSLPPVLFYMGAWR
jgi:hypothetical protein